MVLSYYLTYSDAPGEDMKRFWFSALCIVPLSSCASNSNPTNLVVVGNSITLHVPSPTLGWYGDWGMAAPAADKDFSHLVAATLDVPLSVNNLGIEGEPQNALPQIPVLANKVGRGTAVVLELGDNAEFGGDMAGFASAYNQLAAAMSKGKSLVCVSTFWHYPDVDDIIKLACEAHNGHYAYIGDIFTNPANPDRKSTAYSFWAVNIHPQEWGHRQIAERVLNALRESLGPQFGQ
jgi:hypothetical protein